MIAFGHFFELDARTISPRRIVVLTNKIVECLVSTFFEDFGKGYKNDFMNRAVV